MENISSPPPASPPAAAPPPPPAAAPPPAAPPATEAPKGGGGMDDLRSIVSSLNMTEIAIGILGSAALFYAIYYFKYRIKNINEMKNEVQNKLDELSIKVMDLQSAQVRDAATKNEVFF
jgi:hypothetical protein